MKTETLGLSGAPGFIYSVNSDIWWFVVVMQLQGRWSELLLESAVKQKTLIQKKEGNEPEKTNQLLMETPEMHTYINI